MLRSDSNQWLGFRQSLEADGAAIGFAPLNLLLDVMEEGYDIAQAVLDINVAICHRDQDDLQVFRRGGKGEKHGHYVVAALTRNQYETAQVKVDSHTGSVSMIILRGAMFAVAVQVRWFREDNEMKHCLEIEMLNKTEVCLEDIRVGSGVPTVRVRSVSHGQRDTTLLPSYLGILGRDREKSRDQGVIYLQ